MTTTKMLLNFALHVMETTVVCDKVCTDGYECTNLISDDAYKRRKGFLAEYFVKTPVHITFSFPCNVNISHILLDPYVGQQESCQIELLCASEPWANTCETSLQVKAENANKFQNAVTTPSTNHSVKPPAFFAVSKAICPGKKRICFYNGRFNRMVTSVMEDGLNTAIKSEMRHSKKELLYATSHIMLKIIRTKSGSTAALNNVEIWANVSSLVSKDIALTLINRYTDFITPKPVVCESVESSSTSSKQQSSTRDRDNGKATTGDSGIISVEIPEEFVDPLTCEIMSIPMLLPCGKNIDKSSLDKFSDSEASHGRRARDPFTGVEFTGAIKSIPNGNLKARIDSFLMTNSTEKAFATVPRTLGKGKSGIGLLGKRKLCDNDKSVCISSLITKPGEHAKIARGSDNNSVSVSTTGALKNELKCFKSGNRNNSCLKTPHTKESRTLSTPSSSSSSSSSSVYVLPTLSPMGKSSLHVNVNDNTSSQSHDEQLKTSLDGALFSLLAPDSGINNSHGDSRTHNEKRCSQCRIDLFPEDLNYITPCSHLLCRSCLLSLSTSEVICPKCGKHFQRKELTRSH